MQRNSYSFLNRRPFRKHGEQKLVRLNIATEVPQLEQGKHSLALPELLKYFVCGITADGKPVPQLSDILVRQNASAYCRFLGFLSYKGDGPQAVIYDLCPEPYDLTRVSPEGMIEIK